MLDMYISDSEFLSAFSGFSDSVSGGALPELKVNSDCRRSRSLAATKQRCSPLRIEVTAHSQRV